MTDQTPQGIRVMILDDEIVTVRRLVQALQRDGYEVEGFVSAQEAMRRLQETPPAVVVMDVRLKDADGVDMMQRMLAIAPNTAVILITGYASIEHAVTATKKGAFHYLAKPFHLADLRAAIEDALAHLRTTMQKRQLREELTKSGRFGDIIGDTPAMRDIFKTIVQVAPIDCNVLIQGESGTGKELVAQALHAHSPRKLQPFVSFNCGAFSEELVANELFGHERGAFTGAGTIKLGLLETANGGTVFLDEVGEMPLSMQVKLLRVIQERTFMRVGGVRPISLDVRFVAATNRNIEKMIAAGEFRQDFYYRLMVVMIELPPLRKRKEDIPALATHFVRKAAKRFGRSVPEISPEFLAALSSYPFPGNVRELEHIIERAVALGEHPSLQPADLPPDLSLIDSGDEETKEAAHPLKTLEMDYICDVYRRSGYNQSETARILGISRTTLWRRLREANLLHKIPETS